ncbi:IPT/TIG domain-containing protein [Saccharopolyspora shandongensis]|uniref:IPT/TIG domain-containing protein n=1 Tax=Saccharopolyspora shandongensis TaxID=418495 RepID=UPI0033CFB3F8
MQPDSSSVEEVPAGEPGVAAPPGDGDTPDAAVLAVPTLTSVTPNSGPGTGGQAITINGTSLASAVAVNFGPTAAASFTVLSATMISATTPPGSGTVPVTVTTPEGTSNAVTYTYITESTVTTITPNVGPSAGGQTALITGTNLIGASSVHFGPTVVTPTVLSDTTLQVTTPPGDGLVPVSVTTPSGFTSPITYLFEGPQAIKVTIEVGGVKVTVELTPSELIALIWAL